MESARYLLLLQGEDAKSYVLIHKILYSIDIMHRGRVERWLEHTNHVRFYALMASPTASTYITFALIYHDPEFDEDTLDLIYTAPSYRMNGYATQLLQALQEEGLKLKGYKIATP